MRNFALLASLVVGASAQANLVSNGGFELNDYPGTAYKAYNAGDAGINDWTVGGRSVDIVGTNYAPYAGSYALDLVGTPGPGSVEQTLATTSGTQYIVSLWARSTGGINDEVNVSLGATSQQFMVGSTWGQYSFVATAGSASDLLKIYSNPQNGGFGNTFIDDVNVEAVPEPATMALMGMGLAAIARKRRK